MVHYFFIALINAKSLKKNFKKSWKNFLDKICKSNKNKFTVLNLALKPIKKLFPFYPPFDCLKIATDSSHVKVILILLRAIAFLHFEFHTA